MSDPILLEDSLDLFFADPAGYDAPATSEKESYSVLQLLRHDINICTRTCWERNHYAVFATAMLVFAGIDLLGKFLAGDDDYRKSRPRFKCFFGKYFQAVSQDDQETIYQLRNALMHSFGLYSRDHKKHKEYRFLLKYSQPEGPLISPQGSNCYLVDIRTLQNLFEAAITKYRADVEKLPSLQQNFDAIYRKYGRIWQSLLL